MACRVRPPGVAPEGWTSWIGGGCPGSGRIGLARNGGVHGREQDGGALQSENARSSGTSAQHHRPWRSATSRSRKGSRESITPPDEPGSSRRSRKDSRAGRPSLPGEANEHLSGEKKKRRKKKTSETDT